MALRSLEAMVTTAGHVDSFVAVSSPYMAGCGGLASTSGAMWQDLTVAAEPGSSKPLESPACLKAHASWVLTLLTLHRCKAVVAALRCCLDSRPHKVLWPCLNSMCAFVYQGLQNSGDLLPTAKLHAQGRGQKALPPAAWLNSAAR